MYGNDPASKSRTSEANLTTAKPEMTARIPMAVRSPDQDQRQVPVYLTEGMECYQPETGSTDEPGRDPPTEEFETLLPGDPEVDQDDIVVTYHPC
ncbi:hypothetical protein IWQ60_011913 [Tieghemiomyces parasiticus]|uniref:Uncharacterized protein n=1 Tax=Tieghemiomyces parasiticus TaxID=78921 RepID=A0A9W8DL36_9FUNG|nr:hypothetical protein IWQ60_011913 [Tieghemiomyces parasiticus]